MKKKFLTIAILTLISMASCGIPINESTYSKNQKMISTIVEETSIAQMEISPAPSTSEHLTSSIAQAFKTVLLNKETFLCTNKEPYSFQNAVKPLNIFLNEVTYDTNPVRISEFSIVDLDGDAVPEIVLAMEDYKGYIILRYKGEKIYGNIVNLRIMEEIKEDGTIWSASSSSEIYLSKLFFIGDTFIIDERIHSVDEKYYINDIPISKETWSKYISQYNDLPDIDWFSYSEENVMKQISEDLFSENSSSLSKKTISERQKYLDSLSYLIDMTLQEDLNEDTNLEERNAVAKEYYNCCNDEMYKIYTMCQKNISDYKLDELNAGQTCWKESLEKELSQVLKNSQVNGIDELEDKSEYFSLGDKTLRRICYLINVYYDYPLYD